MPSRALPAFLAVAACAMLLSGCAQSHRYDHHAGARGAMPDGHNMDMKTMCDRYSKMTPEQRNAYREAHHGPLSPQQQAQHEQHMQDRCARIN